MVGEPCTCGPVDEEKLYPLFEHVLEQHRGKPKDLIMVLHQAQNMFGYLPRKVQEMVADALRVSLNEVHGVASFYSFFSMAPKGRHTIRVCMGTACYVRGAQKLVDTLEKDLGVKFGGTTQDRRFTLNEVRCVGACSLAPAVLVGDDVYARVETGGLKEILDKYE